MDTLQKVHAVKKELNNFFVERSEEIHGMMLSLFSGVNLLFIGNPGTAKSMLAESWAKTITKSKYFSWQLHQFSTPEELFGPYSLAKLEKDQYTRITEGKLPEANIAFIDEVFKCSHGNLNALLSILNERVFFDDGKAIPLDLFCVIGASNEIPEEGDKLEAFMDRFSLKYEVNPIVENNNFQKMLQSKNKFDPETTLTLEEVSKSRKEIEAVEVPEGIVSLLIDLRTKLSNNNSDSNEGLQVSVSDRMFRLSVNILKTEAWLHGNTTVTEEDLEILKHVLWSDPADKQKMYSTLLEVVNPQKDKIMQLFYDSQELYDGLLKEKANAKTDKQKRDIEPHMYETCQKIRSAKGKIRDYVKALEDKGRKTNDLLEVESKMEAMLTELYENQMGVAGFKGWD